jgi:integrase
MRAGETTGLRIGDVDWANRRLVVRRTTTKTDAGSRAIPLNDAAYWAMGKLLARAQALGAVQLEHYVLPLAQ